MDDGLAKNLLPEQLTDRKDRIEYLVNIAKILVSNNKNHDQIMQELDTKIVTLWTLSPSTRKDYCDSVIVKLKEVHKLIPKQDDYPKITSKKAAFDHIMYTEQQKAKGPVKENIILEKMVESRFFTMPQAPNYLENMRRIGHVFEPKPGFYQLV